MAKHQTGKADFHRFRMAVNQMLFEGYKTDSDRNKKADLELLNTVIRDRSGFGMIRDDKQAIKKNVIRPDLPDTFCNYLYGAFCLHSVSQSGSSTYPALVMQLLNEANESMSCNRIQVRLAERISKMQTEAGKFAFQDNILIQHRKMLQEDKEKILAKYNYSEQDFHKRYTPDAKKGSAVSMEPEVIASTTTFKLSSVVGQLHQQGILQAAANERSNTRYRLAPPIPLDFHGESLQQQLQRLRKLYMLLNLLSDRLMPQTLGYHCRSTLDLFLQQFGMDVSQIRYPLLIKRDARPRLMVDDDILWSLLSAHVQHKWVQLEFLSFQNQSVLSVPLQPLFIQTYPGEGRHYLAARLRDPDGLASCRPVILPLDRIIRVHILSVSPQDRSREENQDYIRSWFSHSFSGMSPAQEDFDGNPAEPCQVDIYRKPPEDIADVRQWADRHRKDRCCQSAEAIGDVYRFRYLVTRPEDMEPSLLRDSTVTAVMTPGSSFGLRFRQRKQLLETYHSVSPHPWVEILYPPIQKKQEPELKDDQSSLFSPWFNWQLRSTIEDVNRWILGEGCGWKNNSASSGAYDEPIPEMYEAMCLTTKFPLWDKENKRHRLQYVPYLKSVIPARFTYPEMDWLACFLNDPMVKAILGNDYCSHLRDYLTTQLKEGASQVGYRRRFENNSFVGQNAWGRYNRHLASFEDIPLGKLVDALTDHHLIDFDNHTKNHGILSSRNIVPMRLEYQPGAGRLRLMVYNPQEDRFFILPCANMKNIRIHPETLSPDQWEQHEAAFTQYLAATEKTRTVTASDDPLFLQRVYGVLQPYLDTISTDDNNAVLITVKYHDFERIHLEKIQRLLFPGISLPEINEK